MGMPPETSKGHSARSAPAEASAPFHVGFSEHGRSRPSEAAPALPSRSRTRHRLQTGWAHCEADIALQSGRKGAPLQAAPAAEPALAAIDLQRGGAARTSV